MDKQELNDIDEMIEGLSENERKSYDLITKLFYGWMDPDLSQEERNRAFQNSITYAVKVMADLQADNNRLYDENKMYKNLFDKLNISVNTIKDEE